MGDMVEPLGWFAGFDGIGVAIALCSLRCVVAGSLSTMIGFAMKRLCGFQVVFTRVNFQSP